MPFSFLRLPRISQRLLLATALLGGFTAAAQQARQVAATHTLTWTGPKNLTIGDKVVKKALAFKGASFDENGLPVWRLTLANQAITGISLTNAVYEPLTAAEAALIPATYRASQPETSTQIGLADGKPVTDISIIPIRVNSNGQKEKLVSFGFTSQQGQMPANRNSQNSGFATESKLNTGTYYRLAVTNTGIYKIDAAFLSSLGLNPSQVNPQNLKIFGKGGGMLPQPNSAPRHDDLAENAILVQADNNASFDAGEYALFYGQGPHTWYVDHLDEYRQQQNYYSDTTYYFISVDNTPGLRIQPKPSVSGSGQTFTSFEERLAYEKDLNSLIISGREWFGEKMTSFNPSHEVVFPTQGLVAGSNIKLRARLLHTATQVVNFDVALNGQAWGNLAFVQTQSGCECAVSGYGAQGYSKEGFFNKQLSTVPGELKVKVTFNGSSSPSIAGYLDWLVMTQEKQLALYGNQTSFRKRLGKRRPLWVLS